jgi:hypothetical protein
MTLHRLRHFGYVQSIPPDFLEPSYVGHLPLRRRIARNSRSASGFCGAGSLALEGRRRGFDFHK